MQPAPVLDQEFLPLRARLLEIAAALDRLDRADWSSGRDPQAEKIRAAVELVLDSRGDRAEQVQMVFSRPYDRDWREELQMTNNE